MKFLNLQVKLFKNRKIKNKINLTMLIFMIPASLLAQSDDFGIWSSVGIEKKLSKWTFSTEGELRTNNNSEQINRWSLKLETSYNIFKPLKIGLSYQFINFYDAKYSDFQPRNRLNLFLQGKQKLGNFTFTLREQAQVTTKDESDRVKASGKIDTYLINPAWIWRSRIKVDYNIPKIPITPALSFESFYQLNNPNGNSFNKLRYTLSFSYNLTKHHQFEVYGLIDKEINVTDAVKTYIAGVGYVFSF